MRTLDEWLELYGQDHQNQINVKLHLVCVPLIFFAVVALIHTIGYTGDALLICALIWYGLMSRRALALMIGQMLFAIALSELIKLLLPLRLVPFLIAIFCIGWVGQFYGHHVEGKRPSFFRDLQYLLIGPLWVWRGHSRREKS